MSKVTGDPEICRVLAGSENNFSVSREDVFSKVT